MNAIPLPASCTDVCDSPSSTQVPGPAGADGADGAAGSNGLSAVSLTTAQFTQPAVNSNVTVSVGSSSWMAIGQVVFVQNGGYYSVQSLPDSTSVSLKNLGYDGNAAPTTIIAALNTVSTSGPKGADGATPTVTIDDVSPTTSKGDLMVDNGANSPSPSVVRLPAPTNGYVFVADSGQASGWLGTSPKLTATSSLNFSSVTAGAIEDLTIALVGAAVGDPVSLGIPFPYPDDKLAFLAFVSAADVVTVRAYNFTSLSSGNPAAANFTVRINKL